MIPVSDRSGSAVSGRFAQNRINPLARLCACLEAPDYSRVKVFPAAAPARKAGNHSGRDHRPTQQRYR